MKYLILVLSLMLSLGCSPKAETQQAKLVSTSSLGLIQSVAIVRISEYNVVTQINTEKSSITLYGIIQNVPIGSEATISNYNDGSKSIDWKSAGYWITR